MCINQVGWFSWKPNSRKDKVQTWLLFLSGFGSWLPIRHGETWINCGQRKPRYMVCHIPSIQLSLLSFSCSSSLAWIAGPLKNQKKGKKRKTQKWSQKYDLIRPETRFKTSSGTAWFCCCFGEAYQLLFWSFQLSLGRQHKPYHQGQV